MPRTSELPMRLPQLGVAPSAAVAEPIPVAPAVDALHVDSYLGVMPNRAVEIPDRATPFRDVSELLEARPGTAWRNGAELAESLRHEMEDTPGLGLMRLLEQQEGGALIQQLDARQLLGRMGAAALPLLRQAPSGLEHAVSFWPVTPADVDLIVQGIARTGEKDVYFEVVNALLCNPYVSADLQRALLLSTADLSTDERGELAVFPLVSVEPLKLARALIESRDGSRRLLLAEALATGALGMDELPTQDGAALIDRLVHDEELKVRVAISARFWESSDPSPDALRRVLEPVDDSAPASSSLRCSPPRSRRTRSSVCSKGTRVSSTHRRWHSSGSTPS